MIKAGINIGNSKISCVVCDYNNSKKINLLSLKHIATKDVKKNTIINYSNLIEETKKLILECEKESQTKLNSININVPVVESISDYYSSEIFISDEKITELHLKKAINESNYFDKKNEYYEAINNIVSYEIDNKLLFNDPIGNYANKIKIFFYRLLINKKFINNLINLVNDLKLNVDNYIPSPLSSALSTLSEDEKNLGSICIDLGHTTTSTSIFENKKFIYGDAFLVGSNNITNDIARGVSTTLASAERLKTLYGSVISSPSDEYEIIEIPSISEENNQFNQINRSTLNSIIKARVEENLEIVWQKIKQNNLNNKKIKNVVLTGGGAQLEGISEYAKMIFSSNVRLGKPLDSLNLNKKLLNTSLTDIIGTILFNKEDFDIKFIEKSKKNKKNPSFLRFFAWLDQYI